jgi:hypothetical protein
MIPMPYVLVNIVLDMLSLVFFCLTSAALLSRYAFASRWLPPWVRHRRPAAFVAYALALSALLIIARVTGRLRNVDVLSVPLHDVFLYIGVVNSVVLIYQAMDRCCFLNTPRLQRRLLLVVMSVVMTVVPVIAVIAAVFGLFIIR